MERFKRAISLLILGPIAPVCFMLAGWWGTFAIAGDTPLIPWMTLGGLVLGVVLNLALFRGHLKNLFALSAWRLTSIALFYSVMIYGFFMSFPLPLLLVSIGWGFVVGHPDGKQFLQDSTRVPFAARGSAFIVFIFCCGTAMLAFNEPTIADQVRGMLGLSFTPSMSLLVVLSLVGGVGLVVSAYGLACKAASWGRCIQG